VNSDIIINKKIFYVEVLVLTVSQSGVLLEFTWNIFLAVSFYRS